MEMSDPVNAAMDVLLNGDAKKGELLLLALAEGGNGRAAHNLGTLYFTGAPGVSPDATKSQIWFSRALESGFEATVATDPQWFKKLHQT
jgi:TPR repeat protein